MTASNVLLVAQSAHLVELLRTRLAHGDHQVTVVRSFAAARDGLATLPDLLVSEVRLGAFNGLHLALRAHARGIPAIVVGNPDVVLQREAEKIGATYLTADCDARAFSEAVRASRGVPRSHQRGSRAPHAA